MIKQLINIDGYWEVIVYYNVDYNLFDYIAYDFHCAGASDYIINRIYKTMKRHNAKAVTLSNRLTHTSVVVFNKHKNKLDYINSIVHEAEHIKQHMLKAYNVDDFGEAPAYTIGYLVMMMLKLNLFCC